MRWRRDSSGAQGVIRSNHVERRKGISDLERFSIGSTRSSAPVRRRNQGDLTNRLTP